MLLSLRLSPCFPNSRKPTSITKLNSNTIRSSDMLTFIERGFTNSDVQCGEFRVPSYYVYPLCIHAHTKRQYINFARRFTTKLYSSLLGHTNCRGNQNFFSFYDIFRACVWRLPCLFNSYSDSIVNPSYNIFYNK